MVERSIRSSPRAASSGFTYLWVLVLVAFMGVGLVITSEIYTTSVQRDKEYELIAIGRQFRMAIGRYYEAQRSGQGEAKGQYPAALEDLLKDNRSPGIRRHLRKLYVDPMTGRSEWGLVLVGGRIVGVHSLSERPPIKQDGFESEEAGFRGKQKYSEWVFSYPSDLLLRADGLPPLSSLPASSPATFPTTFPTPAFRASSPK